MSFEEEYNNFRDKVIDFVNKSEFEKIDLSNLNCYHVFPSGEDYQIDSIIKYRGVGIGITDYLAVDIYDMDLETLCEIADYLKAINV